MKKELEDYFFNRIRFAGDPVGVGEIPQDIINDMLKRGMINSPKQAWATLDKWTKKGLYDYGISLTLGWRYKEEHKNNITKDNHVRPIKYNRILNP